MSRLDQPVDPYLGTNTLFQAPAEVARPALSRRQLQGVHLAGKVVEDR